ncbi:hypothetical protein PPROV_000231900 [Pycnococcus provasolii]|uniref:Uncharacterized protein n=1 Tax=Pycnococcus provasolii TaxID=41880 RepID=A0A830H954_9CHLO|nr:hypothetical protein PPROV_000231900 [Pycnococcus provasolii]
MPNFTDRVIRHTGFVMRMHRPGSSTSANVSALLEIKNATGHTINLRSGVRSEPLTFSLKRHDGWQASGLFNRSSQCVVARGLTSKYSSDGCIALPNPAPKGIDLRFRQSFLTGESMPLSNAWEIVPPAGSAVHPLLTPPKGVAVFGNVKVCEDTVSNDGYRVFLGRGLCPLLLRDKTGFRVFITAFLKHDVPQARHSSRTTFLPM